MPNRGSLITLCCLSFITWSVISWYWYACGIKKVCKPTPPTPIITSEKTLGSSAHNQVVPVTNIITKCPTSQTAKEVGNGTTPHYCQSDFK